MNRASIASYIIGHVAAACACVGVIVIVPFVAAVVLAIVSRDPGGPLFFPMLLLLLVVVSLAVAVAFSAVTVLADLARFYWKIPIWLPPVLVFGFIAVVGHSWAAVALGGVALLCFCLYWLSVSSIWFLPRFITRILRFRHNVSEQDRFA